MSSAFGIAVTNIMSKAGVLSKKAAVRLSIETGKKLVDKSREVGRMVNKEEVEEIFRTTLPKRCRPKIITTKEEVADVLRRDGTPEAQIKDLLSREEFGAACVTNGTKKYPIWLPLDEMAKNKVMQTFANSFIAHELEHALEKNNRLVDILRRKTSGIKKYLASLFTKNYQERVANRELGIHDFEFQIQDKLLGCVDKEKGVFTCAPTVESIDKCLKDRTGKGYIEQLRAFMRDNYAGAENKGSEVGRRLDKMVYWMNMEKPAYYVTGEVDKYALNLKEGQASIHTYISKCYEACIDIAKHERRGYWKNKLLGRLKKPNIYVTDKDILSHAVSKEDKKAVAELIKDLDKEQKTALLKALDSSEYKTNIVNSVKYILNTSGWG